MVGQVNLIVTSMIDGLPNLVVHTPPQKPPEKKKIKQTKSEKLKIKRKKKIPNQNARM